MSKKSFNFREDFGYDMAAEVLFSYSTGITDENTLSFARKAFDSLYPELEKAMYERCTEEQIKTFFVVQEHFTFLLERVVLSLIEVMQEAKENGETLEEKPSVH